MRNGIVFFVICLLWVGCKPSAPKPSEFRVELDIKGANERKLYLSELSSEGEISMDSLSCKKDGKASFTVSMQNPSMYLIRAEKNSRNFITILPDSGEIIRISASYDSLVETYNVQCEGKALSEIILPIQKKVRKNMYAVDRFSQIWQNRVNDMDADSLRQILDSLYWNAFAEQKQMQIRLASEQTQSIIPVYTVYQLFGDRMLFDFSDSTDLDSIAAWTERMLISQRGNSHVDKLKMRIDRMRILQKQTELKTRESHVR